MQDQAAEIDRKVRSGILTQRQAIDMKLQLLPKRRAPKPMTQAECDVLRKRTPAQVLQQLRRDFGDERRNAALWDTLPMLLQRNWAEAKRSAGEALAVAERRALDYSPRELAAIRPAVRA